MAVHRTLTADSPLPKRPHAGGMLVERDDRPGYIRSVADGNGDCIGDIAGIRARLPYITGLGLDAIWITLWYPSPMANGRYHVAGYRAIEPRPQRGSPRPTGAAARPGFRLRWAGPGSEGRISYLKRRFGLDRTLFDGLTGAQTWCGLGVLAHNTIKIAHLVQVAQTPPPAAVPSRPRGRRAAARPPLPAPRATGPPHDQLPLHTAA